MTNTPETIIKYNEDEQGEALIEFLYAIATKKMTLKRVHLRKILDLLNEKVTDGLVLCLSMYIDKEVTLDTIEQEKVAETQNIQIPD
jgi:hypothetical protein